MRTCATILCLLAIFVSSGLCDDISIGGLTYPGATILEVKDGMVSFRTPGGRTQTKPFRDITGVTLTGLDSFNEAEKLISGAAGRSQADKLRKRLEAKKADIAEIESELGDESGAIKRLKDTAVRLRARAVEYEKSAAKLGKQVADLRGVDNAAKARVSKFKGEYKRLTNMAKVLDRQNKKREAAQRRQQANAILKQLKQLDASGIRAEAAKKRGEAKRMVMEARRMARDGKPNAAKRAANKKKEADRRNQEAEALEAQAKRIADGVSRRNTQITKLARDKSNLTAQARKAVSEAKAKDSKAANYPQYVATRKKKLVILETEAAEMQKELDAMASQSAAGGAKLVSAIRLYQTAAGENTKAVYKAIIDYRLLMVLERAGWIDQASSLWLKLADRDKGSPSALECRPRNFAPKGDTRNAKAISVLKSGVARIKLAPYKVSAQELLVRIMLHENRPADAIEVLDKASAINLRMLKGLACIGAKDYDGALTAIGDVLNQLERDALPEALSIRAKAYLGQAASSADKARKEDLMLHAALDLMRIAALFPTSERAGQSLYLAGKTMAALPNKPNKPGAIKAFGAVADNYAGTPLGKAASAELVKLGVKR